MSDARAAAPAPPTERRPHGRRPVPCSALLRCPQRRRCGSSLLQTPERGDPLPICILASRVGACEHARAHTAHVVAGLTCVTSICCICICIPNTFNSTCMCVCVRAHARACAHSLSLLLVRPHGRARAGTPSHFCSYASTGGHVHTRLRSPYTLSMRPIAGHVLLVRTLHTAAGKPPSTHTQRRGACARAPRRRERRNLARVGPVPLLRGNDSGRVRRMLQRVILLVDAPARDVIDLLPDGQQRVAEAVQLRLVLRLSHTRTHHTTPPRSAHTLPAPPSAPP